MSPKPNRSGCEFTVLPARIITGPLVVVVAEALNTLLWVKWGEITQETDSIVASYFSEACSSVHLSVASGPNTDQRWLCLYAWCAVTVYDVRSVAGGDPVSAVRLRMVREVFEFVPEISLLGCRSGAQIKCEIFHHFWLCICLIPELECWNGLKVCRRFVHASILSWLQRPEIVLASIQSYTSAPQQQLAGLELLIKGGRS